MTRLDMAQARRHIEILRGTPNTQVCWQLFSDSQAESSKPIEYWARSVDEIGHKLQQHQTDGYGVYLTVNPADGNGRKTENITQYSYLFADFDNVPLPQNFPLAPCLITGRDINHTHVYWRLTKCVTANEYAALQRLVAMYHGSDTQVIDVARVARLAGSWQLKNPSNPQQYVIYAENVNAPVYTPNDVYETLQLPQNKQLEYDRWVDNRFSYDEGTGFNDLEVYIEQARHYFANIAKPSMVEGTGRSENVFKVAAYARDRGVRLEKAIELMWVHFNPRCQPPWPDKDYRKFAEYVKRAYRYGLNAVGCKTATAAFATSVVPEPTGGWEHNKTLCKVRGDAKPVLEYVEVDETVDIGHVDAKVADLNMAAITSKSNVHELAIAFIGKHYPDRTLVRNDGIFYRYNGVIWEMIEEEELTNEIEYVMFSMQLDTTKVKNILIKVGNLVYRKEVQFRKWIDHDRRKGNFTICRNGIIQVSEEGVQLLPHDKNYFDLNMLDIDYDPTATAPEFAKFLDSQWADYPDLKIQMQDCYGHALMRSSKHQIIPMLVGKSRSGKSVHVRLLTDLVGERNVCSPSLDGLADDNQILPISEAKVAFIPEANTISYQHRDKVLDRLKLITGGDPLTVNRKYKKSQTLSNWALIIMISNLLPDFIDSSGAYANRVYPIPFFKSFHGMEDKGLYERLRGELAGILNWALVGAMRVAQYDQVFLAQASREMIDDIRYDSFPLSQFMVDLCELDSEAQTSVDDAYDAYMRHCRFNGVKTPMSQRKFSQTITGSAIAINKKRVMVDNVRKYVLLGLRINTGKLNELKPTPTGFSNVTPLVPNSKTPEEKHG